MAEDLGIDYPGHDRTVKELSQTWDWQPRVAFEGALGISSGVNPRIRFRASRITTYVQVHVQTSDAGEGGDVYSPTDYRSSELVETFVDRQQDYALPAGDGERYYVWLIPVFRDADPAQTFVLYDGVDGPDYATFVDLGFVGVDVTEEPSTFDELWSVMHLGLGGVPIGGGDIQERDKAMMLGLYAQNY